MSRHWSKRGGEAGEWVGVISCSRPRCRVEHTWPVENPPSAHDYDWRETDAARQHRKELELAAHKELVSHPLPADWVKLKYMLYAEGDKDNPDFYEFHSPHCAALYLDGLAKQDKRNAGG